jgi:segregation and condensation protein B
MDVNAKQLTAACEAILFAYGEPMELTRLSQALEIEDELTEQVLLNLEANLQERGSGLCLLKLEDKYQLSTLSEYADLIRSVLEIKRNTPLSQAAFEVLAIVAYNQPITKSYIEQVRGVDCSGVIASLCQKKLIEEKGRLDLPGRPLVYGTTPEFLRCFSLSSLDELPPLPENENAKEIENEAENADIIEEDNTENDG